MRRILTIASLLLVSAAHSQTSIVPVGSPTQITEERGGQSAVHLLATPIKEPYDSVYSSFRKKGRLITTSDGHLYHNNGTVYLYCIREDDSTVKYVTPAQFAALSVSVSGKKDAADSTDPVKGYVPQHQLDSAKKAIRSSIGLKLNIADTNAMLANYLRINVAAATYVSLSGSYTNPSWLVSIPWSKLTSTPTTLSGYGITDATSNARSALSLTTTGSGAAGYNSATGVLNVPTPSLSGLGGVPYGDTATKIPSTYQVDTAKSTIRVSVAAKVPYSDTVRNGKIVSKYYADSIRSADRFIDSSSYYLAPLVEHAEYVAVVGGLTKVGNTSWRSTNANTYSIGRANRVLQSGKDGWYSFRYHGDDYFGIILDTTTPTAAPTYLVGIIVYNGTIYQALNNVATPIAGSTENYYRIRRSGSSWYIESSNDERKWTIIHTLSFSYTGALTPYLLMPNPPPRLGRIYEPKLCGFSTKGCMLGNSTVASYFGQSPIDAFMFNSQETATGFSATNIAEPGHTAAQQRAKWEAQSTTTKMSYNWASFELTLNELGDSSLSATTIIEGLQRTIDTVRNQTAKGCKLIGVTMTPAKARWEFLFGVAGGVKQYQKWQTINDAIMGKGSNPITGLDYRFNQHTVLMTNANGNLDTVFEVDNQFDHVHQNNAGRALQAKYYVQALQEMKLLPQRLEIKKPLTVVANLNFGSTAAQNSADLTIPVIGAAVGDRVDLGSPTPASHTNYTAFVSAANTITVRFNNYSSGSVDPAAADFEVTIYK